MNIKRNMIVEVVGNISVSDLSNNAVDIIIKMQELILTYGETVFLDVDSYGCYSGFYEYNVCIHREQTDDEYNHMLAEIESRTNVKNKKEVQRIINLMMNGIGISRKEKNFLRSNGISLD